MLFLKSFADCVVVIANAKAVILSRLPETCANSATLPWTVTVLVAEVSTQTVRIFNSVKRLATFQFSSNRGWIILT